MNFPKKTLFWIIVLISLSGIFYFTEQEAEETRLEVEKGLKLFHFTVDDVSQFWITYLREDRELRVVRSQDGWELIEPLTAKGDNEVIQKLLQNVITARKDAVLFQNVGPAKLKELGLDDPEFEIGFTVGDRAIIIQFGVSGPTNNVAYAMLKGESRIFRVHSDTREEVRIEAYSLRDKTILDFDPIKMTRFVIEAKGEPRIVIEQNKGRWHMLEPDARKATMEKVVETLYEIKNSEVKLFKDDVTTAPESYGFDTPRLRLTIKDEESGQPYILTIGNKDRANRGYFAKTNQSEILIVVEEGLVNAVLRNKDKLAE
ncbi:hypothetical protein MNBD_GAMMA26-864 [hydrothermal vent metagenome]|uniref:DUF4340 domain-containing protein n=1 Tax=hydrothermal vent metagenome TaxID=652676 RepID=A0A3B1C2Y7_9ZZZZ